MRTYKSLWHKLFAVLSSSQPAAKRRRPSTRLLVELLEDRVTPTITFTPADTPTLIANLATANTDTSDPQQTYIFQLAANTTYTLTGAELLVQQTVTASGKTYEFEGAGGTVIDGAGLSRVFEITTAGGGDPVTVSFSNLTIEGGQATDGGVAAVAANIGGGILNDGGAVTLSSVALIGNKALATGTTIASGTAQGGGIWSSGGSLTIKSSSDIGEEGAGSSNIAHSGPGGSASGGGIFFSSGTLSIDSSTIENDQAIGAAGAIGTGTGNPGGSGGAANGGGIFLAGGNLTITSLTTATTITDDVATGGVGGDGSVGKANSGGGNGGAGGNADGGGIDVQIGTVSITGAAINGNTATAGNGGNGATSATSHHGGAAGAAGAAIGGGIFDAGGTLTIDSSTLSTNHVNGGDAGTAATGKPGIVGGAANGGGIFFEGTTLTITSDTSATTITGNIVTAGTGSAGTGATDGGMSGNGGAGGAADGGGIDIEAGTDSITGATISTNMAKAGSGGDGGAGLVGQLGGIGGAGGAAAGGGISSTAATLTIDSTTLAGNQAVAGNGAVGGAGGTGLTGGTGGAGGSATGGGIFLTGGTLTITSMTSATTLSDNIAQAGSGATGGLGSVQSGGDGGAGGAGGTADGGGIAVQNIPADSVNITGASLTGNMAEGGGGGDGGIGTSSGAGGIGGAANGGGFEFSDDNGTVVTLTTVTVASNTAQGGAGGSGANGTTGAGNGGNASGGGISVTDGGANGALNLSGGSTTGNQAIGGTGGLASAGTGGAGGAAEGGGQFVSVTGTAIATITTTTVGGTTSAAGNEALGGIGGAAGATQLGAGTGGNGEGGGLFLTGNSTGSVTLLAMTAGFNQAVGGAGGAGAASAGGSGEGGGIFSSDLKPLAITNSTLAYNTAQGGNPGGTGEVGGAGQGGGLFNMDATANLLQVTVAFNTVASGTGTSALAPNGGSIVNLADSNANSAMTILNSILSNSTLPTGAVELFNDTVSNTTTVATVNLNVASTTKDLVFSSTNSGAGSITTTGFITGMQAFVSGTALANNGGTTPTLAITSTSPAFNAGDNAAVGLAALMFDQRGTPFARIAFGIVDLGAFELQGSSLSGSVYVDGNGNGKFDPGEFGIPGAVVTLTGTDSNGDAVNVSVTTDANGNYTFTSMLPGTYALTITQPPLFIEGMPTVGTVSPPTPGVPDGSAGNNTITDITLVTGQTGVGYLFSELGLIPSAVSKRQFLATPIPPALTPGSGTATVFTGTAAADPSGFVFVDTNGNGTRDPGEPGVGGVTITLTGTTSTGQKVVQTAVTNAAGFFDFASVPAGVYAILDSVPAGYRGGQETIGTLGGVAGTNQITSIVLGAGANGTGYNFGVLPSSLSGISGSEGPAGPTASGTVSAGQPDGLNVARQPLTGDAVPELERVSWTTATIEPEEPSAPALLDDAPPLARGNVGEPRSALLERYFTAPPIHEVEVVQPVQEDQGVRIREKDRFFVVMAAMLGAMVPFKRKKNDRMV